MCVRWAQNHYCGIDGMFPEDQYQFCRVQSLMALDIDTWAEALDYFTRVYHDDDSCLDTDTMDREIEILRKRQKRLMKRRPADSTTQRSRRSTRFAGHYMDTVDSPLRPSGARGGQLVNPPGILIVL